MKSSEILLVIISSLLSLAIGIAIIFLFFPHLFWQKNQDLELVQVDSKVVPFFENVFDWDKLSSKELLPKEPIIKHRVRQLITEKQMPGFGPSDILGFRNLAVPNQTDILIIGDSQTWGNNASLFTNWPSQFERKLNNRTISVYNMAAGGWGAIQYFYILSKGLAFRPKQIVIAFYTGNDPMETFMLAYASERWKSLRTQGSNLTKTDAPSVNFPPPKEETFEVIFDDGVKTVFSPELRLVSNMKHPAIDEAYRMIAKIALEMNKLSNKFGAEIFFTIIPTKELVYEKKIKKHQIKVTKAYQQLVIAEKGRINELIEQLKNNKLHYIDSINALQNYALQNKPLYSQGVDGHPIASGYEVIAESVFQIISPLISNIPQGPHWYQLDNTLKFILVYGERYKDVIDSSFIEKNGWKDADIKPEILSSTLMSKLIYEGALDEVNPILYGPKQKN